MADREGFEILILLFFIFNAFFLARIRGSGSVGAMFARVPTFCDAGAKSRANIKAHRTQIALIEEKK